MYFMAPCACIRKEWHIMNTCIIYFDKNKLYSVDNTRYHNIFECIYHIVVYRDIFLQYCDIVIQKISYRGITNFYIPSSNTGQYKQGNEVLIARTHLETCLVSLLEHYMSWIRFNLTSELFLFMASWRPRKVRGCDHLLIKLFHHERPALQEAWGPGVLTGRILFA